MTDRKKVLIITYYWPPAGGIGVLRCLKFAKYLRKFGWEPVIHTVENAQYPIKDQSNFKDIPEGITVLKTPCIEPFNFYKLITGKKKDDPMGNVLNTHDKKPGIMHHLSLWIRGNLFFPDARALWIKPSVKFLSKYLQENPVDAIFSDGPPHTNTMIAYHLKKKLGIPWVSDYQDPWTQVDYYKLFPLTSWADRKHKKMEQECFKAADKITIASPTWGRQLEEIGASKTEVLYYGYDEDDFKSLPQQLDEKFTISHSGLMGPDRCPVPLFAALKALKEEVPGFVDDLRIVLMGQVDYGVVEEFRKAGLEKNLILKGMVPRAESLRCMINSQILLLPLNQARNAKGRIPGKLYENLRAHRPILSFGPLDSDVANILSNTGAGETFDYCDLEGVKEFLLKSYKKYKAGMLTVDSSDIICYSNEKQTEKLAYLLNKVTARSLKKKAALKRALS
ncbi:hypothetical protein RCC89_09800 [Cytophagaceae bacterium ABcell3]|nr:hypothetical protein RCC89_09800 [Cytophagaceae bacterium ABcell3]